MIAQLNLDNESVKNVLVTFIKDEIHKAGMKKAVLGLSGGVDSALVAFLSAEALGAENVHCVMMPYSTSSPESVLHARLVADALGITPEYVEITPMVDPFLAMNLDIDAVRKGNIMARQRMIILFDRSARENALVVGTGNKTEILLGYSTLYGDSACGINPLGGLYKTQIWQLAEYTGVPEDIIRKAPSADLWHGQTDEEELGFEYKQVDELLYFLIEEKLSLTQLQSKGFTAEYIARVTQRIAKYEFKQRPPRIAAIGSRAPEGTEFTEVKQ
jgi:NAD+ synthase